jgi:hypothetical protein
MIYFVDRVTSRRKQISANEEKHNEMQELEKTCEQLRKVSEFCLPYIIHEML